MPRAPRERTPVRTRGRVRAEEQTENQDAGSFSDIGESLANMFYSPRVGSNDLDTGHRGRSSQRSDERSSRASSAPPDLERSLIASLFPDIESVYTAPEPEFENSPHEIMEPVSPLSIQQFGSLPNIFDENLNLKEMSKIDDNTSDNIEADATIRREQPTEEQIRFYQAAEASMEPADHDLYQRRMNALGFTQNGNPENTPTVSVETRRDKGKQPDWRDREIPGVPYEELDIDNQQQILDSISTNQHLNSEATADAPPGVRLMLLRPAVWSQDDDYSDRLEHIASEVSYLTEREQTLERELALVKEQERLDFQERKVQQVAERLAKAQAKAHQEKLRRQEQERLTMQTIEETEQLLQTAPDIPNLPRTQRVRIDETVTPKQETQD